jgi:hypothetical protein
VTLTGTIRSTGTVNAVVVRTDDGAAATPVAEQRTTVAERTYMVRLLPPEQLGGSWLVAIYDESGPNFMTGVGDDVEAAALEVALGLAEEETRRLDEDGS